PKTDETLDVYYKYVPPIVYYNTSNPYATTYYANGYEYVPNYIAPVVYYAPTYNEYNSGGGYGYDGGTPYSGGNGYSSGAGYSSTSVASRGGYSLYVPQSAYYSKEAQLVAEEGERAEKADEGGFNLGEETRD
ncbi:cell wall anchor protein, partial [Lactococcus lactis subsp. lactis]|nr:cell wall anchor protein [Lactococcus lactis subsp. lactis]